MPLKTKPSWFRSPDSNQPRGNAGRLAKQKHHRRTRLSRRRMLAESLEGRQLLAGDIGLPSEDVGPLLLSVNATAEGEGIVETIDGAAQVGSDAVDSFATGLQQAVGQISRVLSAVNNLPGLASEIPYLGSILPESVGGTTIIDTESIASLFNLVERFDTDVLQPLETFLENDPAATTQRLIAEFDFLEAVDGLASGSQGVRLNFNPVAQVNGTIASLLEPITSQAESILRQIEGEALATIVPLNLGTDNLSFDVLRDAATREFAVRIPNFSIGLDRPLTLPVDFTASIGLLSGGVTGGSISLDAGLDVSFGNAFGATINTGDLSGGVGLDSLQEVSIPDLIADIDISYRGEGLNVTLPFTFDVAGFGSGNTPPVLTVIDDNPFDSNVPEFDLVIPQGAGFDRDSILGFQSLDPAGLVSSIEQVGTLIGAWQEGDLLNTRIPLAGDVTIGDAVQFADSFAQNVTAFLKGEDGTPAFASIQEFINLIPGVNINVAEAIGDVVTYDPETQALDIELSYFSQFDPIIAQADLNFAAGVNGFELGSFTMNPGEDGTNNRLVINGDISTGMKLRIDLSRDESRSRERRNVAETVEGFVKESTPVSTVLSRKGLRYLVDREVSGDISVGNGDAYTVNAGAISDATVVGDLVDRLRVFDGETLVVNANFENDRLVLTDLTGGGTALAFDPGASPFFLSLFPDATVEGTLTSVLLSEAIEITRDTPLETFFDPTDPQLDEPIRSVRVSLRDGDSETVTLGPLRGQTLGGLLDAFTLVAGESPQTQAVFNGSAIVVRDQTLANGVAAFSLNWVDGATGSTLLSDLIPVGYDEGASTGDDVLVGQAQNGLQSLLNIEGEAPQTIRNEVAFDFGRNLSLGPQPTLQTDGRLDTQFAADEVNAVLPLRGDSSRLIIASTGGGIWNTVSANDSEPSWNRSGGSLPSAAITGLTQDVTGQAVFAITGNYDNSGSLHRGGYLYRASETDDSVLNWTTLSATGLPRSVSTNLTAVVANGDQIAVAASTTNSASRVFFSTDGGSSFTAASLPAGTVDTEFYDLQVDKSANNRIYLIGNAGVYRSNDFGASFVRMFASGGGVFESEHLITSAAKPGVQINAGQIATHSSGRVYAAFVRNGQPFSIYFTDDPTSASPTWQQVALPGGILANEGDSGVSLATASGGEVSFNIATISSTKPFDVGDTIFLNLGDDPGQQAYHVIKAVDDKEITVDMDVPDGQFSLTWAFIDSITESETIVNQFGDRAETIVCVIG